MAGQMDKATSESVPDVVLFEWTVEDVYWQDNYASRPYVTADRGYAFYEPAYRYGAESAARLYGSKWDEVEPALREGWETQRSPRATWEEVKAAARDAWDRVTHCAADATTRGRARHMQG